MALLDQVQTDFEARLKELKPLHEEFVKLTQAKQVLEAEGVFTKATTGRKRGRPKGSKTRKARK